MKKTAILLAGSVLALSLGSCQGAFGSSKGGFGSSKVSLKSQADSAAYAMGMQQGKRMGEAIAMSKDQGEPIDKKNFLKGLEDGISDTTKFSYAAGVMTGSSIKKGLINPQQLDQEIFRQAFRNAIESDSTTTYLLSDSLADAVAMAYTMKQQEKMIEEQFGKNKEAGAEYIKKFRADNKDKVKTTESGLSYIVLKEGKGATPTAESTVKVTYKGTLIDGTEFDANEKMEFPVNSVIPGWTEILQMMKVGEKVQVVIPQELAYGKSGSYNIETGSTLVFEIELLEVK